MKVVILAWASVRGFRRRRGQPMIELSGQPVLWHTMKHYAHSGFNEFFIALG